MIDQALKDMIREALEGSDEISERDALVMVAFELGITWKHKEAEA